jgi:hypothetical protein
MRIDIFQHPDHAGLFLTTDGRAFQELTASKGHGGYCSVRVPMPQGRPRNTRRHTLVLETFHGPSNGRVARHRDGNPANDHKDNLRWGTQAQNCQDTVAHGRTTKGVKNKHAKLTDAKVLDIKKRMAAGESQSALAAEFGVTPPTISDISTGRTWGHVKTPKRKRNGKR